MSDKPLPTSRRWGKKLPAVPIGKLVLDAKIGGSLVRLLPRRSTKRRARSFVNAGADCLSQFLQTVPRSNRAVAKRAARSLPSIARYITFECRGVQSPIRQMRDTRERLCSLLAAYALPRAKIVANERNRSILRAPFPRLYSSRSPIRDYLT
jgi:hypothetical protein